HHNEIENIDEFVFQNLSHVYLLDLTDNLLTSDSIDNILQHMENSRKVLVVLSNDFARSKWCQFEMSLAQKLVIDTSIESIVVVLLEDIEAVNMSKPLNALLKTTTYIKWQDNDNKDIFWQMLKTSLKRQYEL
ncbi:toll-like receptor 2, partial [Patella vulgata]|uniref:toll-like receptor 2 n=1 Tax=Patella vulgata TaxID=6465 RepID=UPI0024A9A22E